MIWSDGECSIFRYAGVGRQLLPGKSLKEILKNGLRQLFYFWYALVRTQITMRMARVSCDGESSISRYAGVGRQLHLQKPMKEILRNELDNFLSLLCLGMN